MGQRRPREVDAGRMQADRSQWTVFSLKGSNDLFKCTVQVRVEIDGCGTIAPRRLTLTSSGLAEQRMMIPNLTRRGHLIMPPVRSIYMASSAGRPAPSTKKHRKDRHLRSEGRNAGLDLVHMQRRLLGTNE